MSIIKPKPAQNLNKLISSCLTDIGNNICLKNVAISVLQMCAFPRG